MPLAIVNKAHQANQLYPFAISLIESVKTYERTLEKVSQTKLLNVVLQLIFRVTIGMLLKSHGCVANWLLTTLLTGIRVGSEVSRLRI